MILFILVTAAIAFLEYADRKDRRTKQYERNADDKLKRKAE